MKDCVGVYRNQVVEIFGILTGDDIARAVGIGECVQKGLETALKKLDKGIFGSKLSTATQDAVFENVRDASRVLSCSRDGGDIEMMSQS